MPALLDLVFIDGDHAREAARADLGAYVPKLKPGGLLLMHDFNYESVRQAFGDHFGSQPPVSKGGVHSLQVFQIP